MVMYQGWAKDHEIKNLVWGHYAVVVKILRNKVYLLDPGAYKDWGDGIGRRVMEIGDFQKRWVEKEKEKVIKGWMLSVKPLKIVSFL